MKFLDLVAVSIAVSTVEAVLILLGVLPPLLAYSPGNIFFSLTKLAIIAYASATTPREGLTKNAVGGAVLGFAGVTALCIFSLVGALFGKTVLGLPMVGTDKLAAVMAMIIISNTAVGMLVGVCSGFVAAHITIGSTSGTKKENKTKTPKTR